MNDTEMSAESPVTNDNDDPVAVTILTLLTEMEPGKTLTPEFAARNFAAGEYIGPYVGTLTTDDETIARYCAENILSASLKCDYLFYVNDTYSLDAQNSTHFSRYFNHAEHGNLVSSTDEDELRVDFYAARDIAADEELTFDYGVRYWLWRDAPSADSDSRNFSEPKYRDLRPVEKTLLHPPPVGTVLPLTPLTAEERKAQQAAEAAQKDPEVMAILADPEVQKVLSGLQMGRGTGVDQKLAQRPDLVMKLKRLAHAGLINMEWRS